MSRVDPARARPLQNLRLKLVVLAGLCVLPVMGVVQLWLGQAQAWPALVYPLVSLLAYGVYAHDKRQAGRGAPRTPENVLHALELAGGWPGALIAQQQFRHKTRKVSYQVVFWAIVVAHQAFWVYALFYAGR